MIGMRSYNYTEQSKCLYPTTGNIVMENHLAASSKDKYMHIPWHRISTVYMFTKSHVPRMILSALFIIFSNQHYLNSYSHNRMEFNNMNE